MAEASSLIVDIVHRIKERGLRLEDMAALATALVEVQPHVVALKRQAETQLLLSTTVPALSTLVQAFLNDSDPLREQVASLSRERDELVAAKAAAQHEFAAEHGRLLKQTQDAREAHARLLADQHAELAALQSQRQALQEDVDRLQQLQKWLRDQLGSVAQVQPE
jgi:chromosome segregation ATPase